MRGALLLVLLFLSASISGCLFTGDPAPAPTPGSDDAPTVHDVVVVAVIDTGFNPYHWDLQAAHMPQHQNDDASDDLPLDQDPEHWLPGHPGAAAFTSHQRLNLTMTPEDPDAVPAELAEADQGEWEKVERSEGDEVHMHWIPDSKVVGYVNFGTGSGFSRTSHGVGVSSVSVGNLYGSCPECLLVFVNGYSERATEWVAEQDWIDLQVNSWGYAITGSAVTRDGIYAGSDTERQRTAVERGQSSFFSAGNGQGVGDYTRNPFVGLPVHNMVVQNPTLWSSQKGPDWMITAGWINPDGHSHQGHGKPADLASLGSSYPFGAGSTVTGEGNFSGTSNAAPVIAGTYGRALHLVRNELHGSSRVQTDGFIAQGNGTCGDANPDCALADGRLTVHELRDALFRSAQYTPEGWDVDAGQTRAPIPHETDEMRHLAEGYGSYWGRLNDEGFASESERIVGYLDGSWHEPLDSETVAWMTALSFCRQHLWGTWEHGDWNEQSTLPDPDPDWPTRTWFVEDCPSSGKLVQSAVATVHDP